MIQFTQNGLLFQIIEGKKEVAVVDIRKGAAVISILNEDAYQKKTYLTENAENPLKE